MKLGKVHVFFTWEQDDHLTTRKFEVKGSEQDVWPGTGESNLSSGRAKMARREYNQILNFVRKLGLNMLGRARGINPNCGIIARINSYY